MEITPSQVHKIKNLIDYQKSSVVSRMLINKDSGSITIFAFDKGQKLSEHTAPFDVMVQILDGESEIKISDDKFELKQGDIIVMPANKPHAVVAVKRFKMILTMLKL